MRFFSTKKVREKVLGMEACEIFFPQKNLGRIGGKVPGMETSQIGIPFFWWIFLVDFFETKKKQKVAKCNFATLQRCNFWTFLPFLIKKQLKKTTT